VFRAVGVSQRPALEIHGGNVGTVADRAGGDGGRDPSPDLARAAAFGKAEAVVRAPSDVGPIVEQVQHHTLEIDVRDAVADPVVTERRWWVGPHLGVVGQHEHVGDAVAEAAADPFPEVRRLGVRPPPDEADQAGPLLGVWKQVNVVLKRVRDEPLPQPDPGFAFVLPPVAGHHLIHDRVEIRVVRELHVSADVPREAGGVGG
jgi:hypothetical protein